LIEFLRRHTVTIAPWREVQTLVAESMDVFVEDVFVEDVFIEDVFIEDVFVEDVFVGAYNLLF